MMGVVELWVVVDEGEMVALDAGVTNTFIPVAQSFEIVFVIFSMLIANCLLYF
jgi:hypothetical protein